MHPILLTEDFDNESCNKIQDAIINTPTVTLSDKEWNSFAAEIGDGSDRSNNIRRIHYLHVMTQEQKDAIFGAGYDLQHYMEGSMEGNLYAQIAYVWAKEWNKKLGLKYWTT